MPDKTSLEIRELLDHKSLLLDTNVFIESFQAGEAFKKLFTICQDAHCTLSYNQLIEFEFLRNAFQKEYRQRIHDYILLLNATCLPLGNPKIFFDDVLRIANTYAARQVKGSSFADCAIAAQLKRYGSNLLFLTRNHKDFPLFLFDRVLAYPIDTGHDVIALGLYRYNREKAIACGVEDAP